MKSNHPPCIPLFENYSLELPFHAMRDNPHHGTSILGGMWGARLKLKYLNKPKLNKIVRNIKILYVLTITNMF